MRVVGKLMGLKWSRFLEVARQTLLPQVLGASTVPIAAPDGRIATTTASLFPPALPQVVRETGEQLLQRQIEGLADPQ